MEWCKALVCQIRLNSTCRELAMTAERKGSNQRLPKKDVCASHTRSSYETIVELQLVALGAVDGGQVW